MTTTPVKYSTAAFVAWLREQEPDTVVGMTGSCTRCPYAWFLMNRTGSRWAQVNGNTFSVEGTEYDTPVEIEEFICRVDGDDDEPDYGCITARECLDLIGGVL